MTVQRKNNPLYELKRNRAGGRSWFRRVIDAVTFHGERATAQNLLDVSSEGVEDKPSPLPDLPKPSEETINDFLRLGNWVGVDLSGLDLREVMRDYPPRRLDRVNLTGCDLRGVSLARVTATNVNLTGARTEGMHLADSVDLRHVITGGTFDMTGVVIGKTRIEFAERTRLTGLDRIRAPGGGGWGSGVIGNVDFSGETFGSWGLNAFVEIRNSDFTGAVFEGEHFANGAHTPFGAFGQLYYGCEFTDATMKDARAGKAVFWGCRFVGADLQGWTFEGENSFHECDFTDANMTNWRLTGPDSGWFAFRKGIVLDGADLTGADGAALRSIVRSNGPYESYSISDAAKRIGRDPEEFGMLVWFGEVEARDKETFEPVYGVADDSVHIPAWSLKRFAGDK